MAAGHESNIETRVEPFQASPMPQGRYMLANGTIWWVDDQGRVTRSISPTGNVHDLLSPESPTAEGLRSIRYRLIAEAVPPAAEASPEPAEKPLPEWARSGTARMKSGREVTNLRQNGPGVEPGICADPERYPVVGDVEGLTYSWTEDGRYNRTMPSHYDIAVY